ncbi:hypothetical protein GCM10010170_098440 [Dactylosporangium salmoneum]|uniref:Transposase n=1 Tax=Dactylosporangium salmoneum TaxID=53361 RepID=A0ABN3HUQ9_9ACTN
MARNQSLASPLGSGRHLAAHRPPPRPAQNPVRPHPGRKAHSISAIRADLRRPIAATIPERADQQANRRIQGAASGRPPAFDAERYKQRNTVERAVSKLKQFGTVAGSAISPQIHETRLSTATAGRVLRRFESFAVVSGSGLRLPASTPL